MDSIKSLFVFTQLLLSLLLYSSIINHDLSITSALQLTSEQIDAINSHPYSIPIKKRHYESTLPSSPLQHLYRHHQNNPHEYDTSTEEAVGNEWHANALKKKYGIYRHNEGGGGANGRHLLQVFDGDSNDAIDTANYSENVAHNNSIRQIPLTNYNNAVYEGFLYVGTPPQKVLIDFDTGSSDFWILGDESLKRDAQAANNYTRFYKPKQSSTFHNYSVFWAINYVQGPEDGYLASDTVMIGNIKVPNATVAIGTAFADAGALPQQPIDGVMGLGYHNLTTRYQRPYPTILENLYKNGNIPRMSFSFIISKAPEGKVYDDAPGENTLILAPSAELNQVLAPQGMVTATVFNPERYGFHLIPMDNVLLNGLTNGNICNGAGGGNTCLALMDSGTTLITMPTTVYRALTSHILTVRPDCTQSSSGRVRCDIANKQYDSLPTLSFIINGTDFRLTPSMYFLGDRLGAMAQDPKLPNSTNSSIFVLGDVFLTHYYALFDLTSKTVSLSKPHQATAGLYDAIPQFLSYINPNQTISVPIDNPLGFYNPPPLNTFLDDLPSLLDTLNAYSNRRRIDEMDTSSLKLTGERQSVYADAPLFQAHTPT